MKTIIDSIKECLGISKEIVEEAIINEKGYLELINSGKTSIDKYKQENHLVEKLVCIYDLTSEEKEILQMSLSEMRNGYRREYFKPVVVNYNKKDVEKQYPIYHYLRSDIEIYKKILADRK